MTAPLKDEVEVQNNYLDAVSWLASTEKKLSKDAEFYIRKVDNLKEDLTRWYLPHFPVLHKDKATTSVNCI